MTISRLDRAPTRKPKGGAIPPSVRPAPGRTFSLTLADGRRVTITNGDLGDFAVVVRRGLAQAGYTLGGDSR